MAPQDLLAQALKLSAEDRARMVRELAKSLDDDGENPADVERAWATEIERRARPRHRRQVHRPGLGRRHSRDRLEAPSQMTKPVRLDAAANKEIDAAVTCTKIGSRASAWSWEQRSGSSPPMPRARKAT